MKKLALTLAFLSGIGFAQTVTTTVTTIPAAVSASAPVPVTTAPSGLPAGVPTSMPKQVHIVVGEIKCATYGCNGDAIADALTNALTQTDNFAVFERSALKQGLAEGMLQGTDAGNQLQGADVLVTGTITAYGEESGGGSGCFLGVCMGKKSQRVAANLRIFDVKTSRVIGTTQAEGLSSGTSGSLNFHGLQLGGNQNSGIDKALAAMLNDAVQKLISKIPANYYY